MSRLHQPFYRTSKCVNGRVASVDKRRNARKGEKRRDDQRHVLEWSVRAMMTARPAAVNQAALKPSQSTKERVRPPEGAARRVPNGNAVARSGADVRRCHRGTHRSSRSEASMTQVPVSSLPHHSNVVDEPTLVGNSQLIIIAPVTVTTFAVLHAQPVREDVWVEQLDVSIVVRAKQTHA
jgi:hypothetical protein